VRAVSHPLSDEDDDPPDEPHPELELSSSDFELEPHPELELSSSDFELEPHPELSLSSSSLLLQESIAAPHPSAAAAGAASDGFGPEPAGGVWGEVGSVGADGAGGAGGRETGAHATPYPPAALMGLDGAEVANETVTSLAVAVVTRPSIRVSQTSVGESAATASAASSADPPQRRGSIGVGVFVASPPSPSAQTLDVPGATPRAPAGQRLA